MSREQSVSSALRVALIATLVPVLLAGCIFSPKRTELKQEDNTPDIAGSPQELVQVLAKAYRTRNIDLFTSILAYDPANRASYLFVTAPDPASGGLIETWDYVEEVKIHQRMFEPFNTLPGQEPVPSANWLTSVSITLSQSASFTERVDLYATPQNPDGLDPNKWKAEDATYNTDVLFDLQGGTDFAVSGKAAFVVITDLTKEVGEVGKFLLLQWNDIDGNSKPQVDLPL